MINILGFLIASSIYDTFAPSLPCSLLLAPSPQPPAVVPINRDYGWQSLLPAVILPFAFKSVILFITNHGNIFDIAAIKNLSESDKIGHAVRF